MEAYRSVWPHCIASAERIHVRVGSSEKKEIKSATCSPGIFQSKTLWRLREISSCLTVITMKKSLAVELCCFCKLTYETSQFPAAMSLSHWYDIFSKSLLWKPGSSDTISFSKSLHRLTDWSDSLLNNTSDLQELLTAKEEFKQYF